ncbi:hypothetical protein SAMN05414139_09234 [Burkholderia sp. D7]|nr:hypothetical protein SAMN05414139_09234 [Burkholderia sp. D7]
MSVDDYRQQDLSHIEKMIVELERLIQNGPIIAERNPVTRPEYWRNRIHALVNSSHATVATEKHADVLLERLANLSELSAQHDQIGTGLSNTGADIREHPSKLPVHEDGSRRSDASRKRPLKISEV